MAGGTITNRARGFVVTVSVAIGGVAACGDPKDEPAVGVLQSAPTSVVQSSVLATPASTPITTFEGVVVTSGYGDVQTDNVWWVIDLAGGVTIHGGTRVLVEIPYDQLGCGDLMRTLDSYQVHEGATVSFELADEPPGDRPSHWFNANQSFESEPAVRGRQLRAECPPGTEEVAAELAAQRATWERQGPDSYDFTMRIEVFGPWYGEWQVAVVAGEAVSIVGTDESQPDVTADFPATIDSVFDVLERMVTADRFAATYNTGLGYPTSVVIDNYLNAVDDEFSVFVTSLTPAAG